VRDDLERREASDQHVIADDPICYRPMYLDGIRVADVPHYDFTCDHDYYDYFYDNEIDESEFELDNYDHQPATHYNTSVRD